MKNKYVLIIILGCLICVLNIMFTSKNRNNILYQDPNVFDYEDDQELVVEDNKLIQTIASKYNNLNKVYIFLDKEDIGNNYKYGYLTLNLEVCLKDSNKKTIAKYKYEKIFYDGERFIEFSFPKIENSRNKKYYLYINSIRPNNNLKFNIVKSNDPINKLKINNKKSNYSLIYYTSYKNNNNDALFKIIITISLLIIGIGGMISFRINKIHNKYLFLSLIIGFSMLFLTPLYQGQDETGHISRIYELSNGHMVTKSKTKWPEIEVPSNLMYSNFNSYKQIEGRLNNKKNNIPYLVDMQYTSVYSLASYLPQTIALRIIRFITDNMFLWPYVVRIVQLIISVLLIYYAIRIIPFGKKIIFLIGLLPSTISQISLISADAILISTFILFISKILQVCKEKEKIDNKDYLILLVSGLFVALSKLVYLPLTLLLLLIPLNKKGDKKKIVLMLLCIFLITIIWNSLASISLVNGQGVNVKYYLNYYLKNPLDFINITLHTFIISVGNYTSDLFGGRNSWYGTLIEDASFVPLVLFILFIINGLKGENRLDKKDKIFILVIMLITYLLISTSLLFTCTPVNYKEIIGIQGRYFIPFLPLIYLVISNNKKDNINIDYTILIIVVVYLYYFTNIISSHI